LEDQVGRPVVAHDKDHIALPSAALGRELADIHAAEPVVGNAQFGARLPRAVAKTLFSNGRIGLLAAGEGAKLVHQSSAIAPVVSQAIDVEREARGRARADVE